MRQTYKDPIKELRPNEVFVFGSNIQGFHGAGAAGYASFGVFGNPWREFKYDEKPNGWKGRWNVKGINEGFQIGTDGQSYAIPTIIRPGIKLSRTMDEIKISVAKMYDYANLNKHLDFLVAGSTKKIVLNGYSHEAMCQIYSTAGTIPDNVIFSKSYTEFIHFNDWRVKQ